MAKVKYGEYIFPRCIVRNGKRICRPNGKRFKFKRYIRQ